jgi:hypothetical protein
MESSTRVPPKHSASEPSSRRSSASTRETSPGRSHGATTSAPFRRESRWSSSAREALSGAGGPMHDDGLVELRDGLESVDVRRNRLGGPDDARMRRPRATRHRRIDDERELADLEHVARREHRPRDPLTVDEDAVGAAEILDLEETVVGREPRVTAGQQPIGGCVLGEARETAAHLEGTIDHDAHAEARFGGGVQHDDRVSERRALRHGPLWSGRRRDGHRVEVSRSRRRRDKNAASPAPSASPRLPRGTSLVWDMSHAHPLTSPESCGTSRGCVPESAAASGPLGPASSTRGGSAASTPASRTGSTQAPRSLSREVHTLGGAHPLPPWPRQPSPHVPVRSSQTRPLAGPPQSVSTRHSPHVPEGAQIPERHTDASVHASPLGKPHFASRWKQTPLAAHGVVRGRTARLGVRETAAIVGLVTRGGEARPRPVLRGALARDGRDRREGVAVLRLGRARARGAKTRSCGSRVSTVHTAPHEPVVRLQMGPARPTQSAFDEHFPHAPVAPQNGSVDVGQALGPAEPKSLVHPSQTFDVVHTGRTPAHS